MSDFSKNVNLRLSLFHRTQNHQTLGQYQTMSLLLVEECIEELCFFFELLYLYFSSGSELRLKFPLDRLNLKLYLPSSFEFEPNLHACFLVTTWT
jgi:hypothetical protein